jgi:hypothetical protein
VLLDAGHEQMFRRVMRLAILAANCVPVVVNKLFRSWLDTRPEGIDLICQTKWEPSIANVRPLPRADALINRPPIDVTETLCDAKRHLPRINLTPTIRPYK